MMNEDMRIATKVYDRTSVFACLCFDSAEEIQKAQQFVCVLIKRGVLAFPEEIKHECTSPKDVSL